MKIMTLLPFFAKSNPRSFLEAVSACVFVCILSGSFCVCAMSFPSPTGGGSLSRSTGSSFKYRIGTYTGAPSAPSLTAASPWVRSFCESDEGRSQALIDLPAAFIEDPVVAGPIMDVAIKKYKSEVDVQKAMLLILGRAAPGKAAVASADRVDRIAQELYCMFHAKYVLTNAGLRALKERYLRAAYGACPRVCCDNFPLLPLGLQDAPGLCSMQCFCASCRDVYTPPETTQRNIDGAFFGTSLPHYFLHRNVDLAPLKANTSYVPRLFGFRMSPRAQELVKYRAGSINL